MEQGKFQNLVSYLAEAIFPEGVLNSKIPSKEKANFRRKASTFRVSKDSKLFKAHMYCKCLEMLYGVNICKYSFMRFREFMIEMGCNIS